MTERVLDEWERRVAAEYRSAAVTAQVLTWAIQVGLPPELLHTAARIVRDELDHAALSRDCREALGGSGEPAALTLDGLILPDTAGVLGSLVVEVMRSFCLGETLAVPYFAAMRARATHSAVRPVLDRILADEAVHRAFGWDALDALLALDPGVGPWLAPQVPGLLATFDGYRVPPDAPPLTEDERACGLLDHAEYAALFQETLAADITPRLAKRGLAP